MPAACDPGCMSCSTVNPSFCSACNPGYYLSSGMCMACNVSSLCMTCQSSNNAVCLTCFPGSFLDSTSNTCMQCKSPCASCQNGNASVCTSCPVGYVLNSSTCVSVSSFSNSVQTSLQNCANVVSSNSSTTCSFCLLGYTLTSGGCAPCISGCIICNPVQLITCTVCAPGYYLNSQ